MKRKNESRNTSHSAGRLTAESRIRAGSALILVVVLTSLLAIVGVMFVMVARVDRMATSAISENKTLDYAVEAVIARISQELALDVPGMPKGREDYYDYPDANNAWLASLEPYDDGTYKWRQISDVTGFLEKENWGTQDIEITNSPLDDRFKAIIENHKKIELEDDGDLEEQLADADGDGVADSKWIELEGINSSKGKTIFAAVRVIDNGGMLNVNTAYKFDPNGPGVTADDIDGSTQMQINLMALASLPGEPPPTSDHERDLLEARANYGIGGVDPFDLYKYEENVVWRYNEPNGSYTPFDISDELELRYRFLVNQEDIDTRLEELGPIGRRWGFREYAFRTPAGTGDLGEWFISAYGDGSLDPNYAYRHIGTTYNMDRIINPYGGKMVNINRAGADYIYSAIGAALFTADPNFKDIDEIAAQTAVNLVDFRDGASEPNVTTLDVNGITYYGFERPCVYISELAHRFVKPDTPPGIPVPGSLINRSYAIELHKPYTEDKYPEPNRWQLSIEGYPRSPIEIDWSGTQRFHVMLFEHPNAPLEDDVDFDLTDKDPNFDPSAEKTEQNLRPGTLVIASGRTISLERRVGADWITVDSVVVPFRELGGTWLAAVDDKVHSYQRDITLHKCIRRLWDNSFSKELSETLGSNNVYKKVDSVYIQAHPANRDFTNVGEIGMVFRKGAYYQNDIDRPDRIGYGLNKDEEQVRLDLADPNYHNIFKYLTVFDPTSDGINNDGDEYTSGIEIIDEFDDNGDGYPDPGDELKIPGRININTAPWYVIAQLPWMTDKIAQAIVAYRDKAVIPDQNNIDYSDRYAATDINGLREEPGFASIGELATVVNDKNEDDYSIAYYALDSSDLAGFPDLTPGGSTGDDAIDDFEERDVIFARLSNLVTVRSDVFSAYILVRIGADGPQKRVMAILDRSNVYPPEGGKVRIVALHAVADPR